MTTVEPSGGPRVRAPVTPGERKAPRWPRADRARATRALQLARQLCALPAHARFEVAGLGPFVLSVESLLPEGAPAHPPGGPWPGSATLHVPHPRGDLLVEVGPSLVRGLLDRVLGAAAPVSADLPPSPVELGVLAAVVARVIEALTGGVPALPARPVSNDALAVFDGRVPAWALVRVGIGAPASTDAGVGGGTDGTGMQGLVRVAWLPEPRTATGAIEPEACALARVPFLAVVETSATRLSWAELARAVPGDTLVFTGVPAAAGGARPLWLRLGAARAAATLGAGGALAVTGPFTFAARPGPGLVASCALRASLLTRPMPEPTSEPSPSATTTATQPAGDPATVPGSPVPQPTEEGAPVGDDRVSRVLAQAPVELVAELARLTLTGAEVVGLRAGMVLGLGRGSTQAVSVTAGGQVVARGTLVDLDGELGVELSEILL